MNICKRLLHKSDVDRKVEIVKYARKTRSLLIRLLALVKWAGNSSSVQRCAVSESCMQPTTPPFSLYLAAVTGDVHNAESAVRALRGHCRSAGSLGPLHTSQCMVELFLYLKLHLSFLPLCSLPLCPCLTPLSSIILCMCCTQLSKLQPSPSRGCADFRDLPSSPHLHKG